MGWNEAVFGAETHSKEFPSDFDRLVTILQEPHSLSAATPEWLDLGMEHRTRYETYDNSFKRDAAGSNQMVHQRTRIFLGIKDIWDPVRFTLEAADFRAPVADRGLEHNPFFSIIWIFFSSTLTWWLRIFWEQEHPASLKSVV